MSDQEAKATDIRSQLRATVEHLEHILPGQAPLQDFVHHNTLHGLQHLPFTEAVAEARRFTGNRGYLPAERFRELLAQGRITREDLIAVLDADPALDAADVLLERAEGGLSRRDVYLGALGAPLALASLLGKVLAPDGFAQLLGALAGASRAR